MSTSEHDDTTSATGAEGSGSADTAAPFAPSKDDDSPLGSTDQHSKVSHDGKSTEESAAKQDPSSTD